MYVAFKISFVPKASSILNSIFLLGANPERLSGNTVGNSYTTKVSFTPKITSFDLFTICAKYAIHPLLSISLP